MSLSIEALQSRSKLTNVRSQEFAKLMWPELREKKSQETLLSSKNLKNIALTVLAKCKEILGQTPQTDVDTKVHEASKESSNSSDIESPDVNSTAEN